MPAAKYELDNRHIFTQDEVDDIFLYIAEGNIIVCSQCGTRNKYRKVYSERVHRMNVFCENCEKPMERPVLHIVQDTPESQAKAEQEIPEPTREEMEEMLQVIEGPSDFGDLYDTSDASWQDPNKVGGKYMAGVLEDFLPALKEIAKLGSMNNKPFGKYERGSWMKVENPELLYLDAFWRHINEGRHNIDPESNLPHDVAIAWNAIALVWFRLRREGKI